MGRTYSEVLLDNVGWSGQSASQAVFNTVIFKDAHLDKTRLRSVQVCDVRFAGGDIALGDWIGATFRRAEFLKTRLSGFNASEGSFRDVVFRDCQLSYAVFQFTKFERCRFEDCDLVDSTFQGATLTEVTFRHCNLASAQFSDARLTGLDLRGSHLPGLQMAMDQLREVTIDPSQAAVIASLTQVKIRPVDEE